MSHFYTGIGVPYYEHGNFIKLSRAAVLSKLLAIAAIRDGIHMAIAQLLPQPVAEEITPSIWVLDEVFGVFDSDWIMDAYKLSGIIAEILPALASEIIPHMYALDEMIIV
jgi:hypothetical protein